MSRIRSRTRQEKAERTRKQAERSAAHAQLDALRREIQGKEPAPAPVDVGARAVAELAIKGIVVAPAPALALATAFTRDGQPLAVARRRAPGAPLTVEVTPAIFFAQQVRLRSPTWLTLVRALSCSCCGRPPPCEPNHFPGRGRSAGGSDFETHPACGGRDGCHVLITDERRPDLVARQPEFVAKTMHTIFEGFRTGQLQYGLLVAVFLEAVVNQGSSP